MTTIKIRRGQSGTGTGKWGTINPTLAAGEFGLETDTGKLKIGDGTTAWNSLLYIADGSKITGTALASNVVSSSLTSLGTLTGLTMGGTLAMGSNNITGTGTISATTFNGALSGTATKATNIAGGATGKIAVQSAADTTVFSGSPSSPGLLLTSALTTPYVQWTTPLPYKLQAGVATTVSGSYGSITVTFASTFDYAPVVTVTAVGTATPTSVTISSIGTSGFTANIFVPGASSPYQWVAASSSRVLHWTAVQPLSYSPGY